MFKGLKIVSVVSEIRQFSRDSKGMSEHADVPAVGDETNARLAKRVNEERTLEFAQLLNKK